MIAFVFSLMELVGTCASSIQLLNFKHDFNGYEVLIKGIWHYTEIMLMDESGTGCSGKRKTAKKPGLALALLF